MQQHPTLALLFQPFPAHKTDHRPTISTILTLLLTLKSSTLPLDANIQAAALLLHIWQLHAGISLHNLEAVGKGKQVQRRTGYVLRLEISAPRALSCRVRQSSSSRVSSSCAAKTCNRACSHVKGLQH